MKVVLGIRFSSWIQLEKRIPSQSLLKGGRGRDEGCLGDPLFELKADPQPSRDEGCLGDPIELESGNPARKADPQAIPPDPLFDWNPAFQLEKQIPSQSLCKGAVMKVVLGIRFSSWNPAFQLEKRIPSQSLLKGDRDEGCVGDPLFELESGNPARKAGPQPIPPERGL